MKKTKLSALERVKVSEAWADENRFSDWLAEKSNIDLLGEAIGLGQGRLGEAA